MNRNGLPILACTELFCFSAFLLVVSGILASAGSTIGKLYELPKHVMGIPLTKINSQARGSIIFASITSIILISILLAVIFQRFTKKTIRNNFLCLLSNIIFTGALGFGVGACFGSVEVALPQKITNISNPVISSGVILGGITIIIGAIIHKYFIFNQESNHHTAEMDISDPAIELTYIPGTPSTA